MVMKDDKPFKWGKFRKRCYACGVKDYEENLIDYPVWIELVDKANKLCKGE
jgi:hypothetical protein